MSDLFGLLDALQIERAHLVGLSQGGMVAQLAALAQPERVTSLGLLSTSPSNSFDPELEPADPTFFLDLARRSRRLGVRAMLQPLMRGPLARELTSFYLTVSGAAPSATRAIRSMVDEGLEHARFNPRSGQGFAVAAAPSRVAALHRIAAPTLVLHGERDVFFPPSHAAVLAKRIPDARLITIPELGHGLPIEFFAPYRDKIIANFERAGRPRGERAEPAECRIPSAS